MNKTTWDLEDGLKLVRAIQPEAKKFGYHVALGGSVLNDGLSEKDIDLYFLPFENEKVAKGDQEGLLDWLEKIWGLGRVMGYYDNNLGGLLANDDGPFGQPRYQARYQAPAGVVQYRAEVPVVRAEAPVPWDPPPLVDYDAYAAPAQPPKSVYLYKMTFKRVGGDRIDCFIL